jgi:Predicted membrane protein (DUF2142)
MSRKHPIVTTTEARTSGRFRVFVRRFRWIYLAPVLAMLALTAWAFASPIGAGPDDDYHLVSTWCANGGSEQCQPGPEASTRVVPPELVHVSCYAQLNEVTASCQELNWTVGDLKRIQTARGNFVGEYPPVYYAAMHFFTSSDIQTSALVMRILNGVLFVGLATALTVLLPATRRRMLLWGWLVTLVPLGMFLIPSNNPSGWAITGVGTAFLALLGWFETEGRRRWALAALYLLGVLMAAGARADAAIYVVGATATVLVLTVARTRWWLLSAILPAVGLILAVALFATAGQSGVGATGFTSDGHTAIPSPGATAGGAGSLSGLALAAYNLLMLPLLWTGVWGTWGLGWLDTAMPATVPWAAAAAFIVVAFAGLGWLSWRKAIAVSGVLIVLVALPVYVLTQGGDQIPANLQPRYLLPLIVLLAFLLLYEPIGRALSFTRVQAFAILGALALANLVALQVNIRRYVTGVTQQGFNLDSGAEWWWAGFPIGPTALWAIGTLAFAGLLAILWPELRRTLALSAPPFVPRSRSGRRIQSPAVVNAGTDSVS